MAVVPTLQHTSALLGHTLTASSTMAPLGAVGMTIRGEPAFGQRFKSRHNLVSGRSKDLNHDAVMRIGGEAPGRRTHSRNRCQHHGLLRVTATSDRHRIPTMFCSSGSESLFCPSPPLTPLAIRRQPEPRQWSPDTRGQLATCAPAPRSLFCVFCQRSQSVPERRCSRDTATLVGWMT